MPDYRIETVRSVDGTTIAYRDYGAGSVEDSTDSTADPRPGLILVHGGMKAAQHLTALATDLSDTFHVYTPDRRGRGRSGPPGPAYGIRREVEDLQALITATGARYLFGHSAGGLASLRTALAAGPALARLAVYEPPLSVHGSAPTAWLSRFDAEIAAGRRTAATVTALKGLGTEPLFSRLPRWLLTSVGAVALRTERTHGDESSIADLVPTIHYDIELIKEMNDTAPGYAALEIPVLLLGGTKSPEYLDIALRELVATLPHAQRLILVGLDHQGPEESGSSVVAQALREFFTA